jgi:two-component system response regulator AtoC/two-component system response regulator HupR/HoxA
MRDLQWADYEVLVVDDEPDNLDAFRFAFRKSFRLHYARSGAEALTELGSFDAAVVVADQRMPNMSGIELLGKVKSLYPECYAILLTAYADLDVLIEAVNSGAVDRYVQKPWDSKEFAVVLRQGIESFVTRRENRRMREQLAQYAGYLEREQRDPIDFGALALGGSEASGSGVFASQALLDAIAEVAPTRTPVLIEGEEGLEKEVIARAIHVGSPREERPFVSVMCAGFPGAALEHELFGWRRGAFEGALQDRAGRVELADGGTLWLHEPSELTPSLQARLLRLLGDGEVERVGDTQPRRVDVRLIVSASPSLGAAYADAPLLPDLAARLAVFPIRLEPLRERKAQVRHLAEHFLRRYALKNARGATAISGEAIDRLQAYDWPGNVRELEHVIERAAILARSDPIGPQHLSFESVVASWSRGGSGARKADVAGGDGDVALDERLDQIERRELIKALEKHSGNKAEVARALGIHRTTLYYRLKKHGLDA